MGQCVKVLAVKLEDLSLIPWTYMVERDRKKEPTSTGFLLISIRKPRHTRVCT